MNVQANLDIVSLVSANPVSVLVDEAKYSELYRHMVDEVAAHVPDVATEKGRKEIGSLAYKVTRTKTAIDAAGKKLNEEARAKINAVDASRRKIRDELDALAEQARQPLTEWEDAEKARQAKIKAAFNELHALIQTPAPMGASAECIADRIGEVESETYDAALFGDRLVDIEAVRAQALQTLRATHERVRQHEADQAELARLRAEQEARERAAREAQEREEAKRIEAERSEREAAESKAREERAAQVAREDVERAAAERVAKAEAEARAVREKAEREERERQEALERTRREEAARAADREHRGKIMAAAKEAIMAQGAGEASAKKIVLAIIAGEIPNVSLKF